MPGHDAGVTTARQARGQDEFLLAQGQKFTPDTAGQMRPSDERENRRDRDVNLQCRPFAGQRRRQGQPQREVSESSG